MFSEQSTLNKMGKEEAVMKLADVKNLAVLSSV